MMILSRGKHFSFMILLVLVVTGAVLVLGEAGRADGASGDAVFVDARWTSRDGTGAAVRVVKDFEEKSSATREVASTGMFIGVSLGLVLCAARCIRV